MRTILAALAVCIAMPAWAQNPCGLRPKVIKRLAEGYGESRQSMGLGANNSLVEVFASEGGSWTITVTAPNGITCLLASGQAFEPLNEPLVQGEEG